MDQKDQPLAFPGELLELDMEGDSDVWTLKARGKAGRGGAEGGRAGRRAEGVPIAAGPGGTGCGALARAALVPGAADAGREFRVEAGAIRKRARESRGEARDKAGSPVRADRSCSLSTPSCTTRRRPHVAIGEFERCRSAPGVDRRYDLPHPG